MENVQYKMYVVPLKNKKVAKKLPKFTELKRAKW